MTPSEIHRQAQAAGEKAAFECSSHGCCGFAWVNIKPGTSKFARFLKENGIARKDSYFGGVSVWVSVGGQSIDKKEAYAGAYADVLQANGIRAFAMSRMD